MGHSEGSGGLCFVCVSVFHRGGEGYSFYIKWQEPVARESLQAGERARNLRRKKIEKRMQEGNLPYTGGWSTPAARVEGKEERIGPKAVKFADGKGTRWRRSH